MTFQTQQAAQAAIAADLADVVGVAFYGPAVYRTFGLSAPGWYHWNRVTKSVVR